MSLLTLARISYTTYLIVDKRNFCFLSKLIFLPYHIHQETTSQNPNLNQYKSTSTPSLHPQSLNSKPNRLHTKQHLQVCLFSPFAYSPITILTHVARLSSTMSDFNLPIDYEATHSHPDASADGDRANLSNSPNITYFRHTA